MSAERGTPAPPETGTIPDAFQDAEETAATRGIAGFCAWRMGLERRFTVMPPWYWNEQECRRRYIAHVHAAIDWQQREHRINQQNTAFIRTLSGRPP